MATKQSQQLDLYYSYGCVPLPAALRKPFRGVVQHNLIALGNINLVKWRSTGSPQSAYYVPQRRRQIQRTVLSVIF